MDIKWLSQHHVCACYLNSAAYCLLPPKVGTRNGDGAATKPLKYSLGVAVSIKKSAKRDYEMQKACEICITTADMFIKIQASITFASEIGHESESTEGRVSG